MSETLKCQCGNSSFTVSIVPWGNCQKCNKTIEDIVKDHISKRDEVIGVYKGALGSIAVGGIANMPPNELSLRATRQLAKRALLKADSVLKEK